MNVEHSFSIATDNTSYRFGLLRWLEDRKWFLMFVIVPTFLSAIYYGLIASDVYISEARFVIKSADQKRPQLSTLANLIQTTGLSSGQEQANEVLEFIRSRDALKDLETSIGLRAMYGAPQGDFLARFPRPFQDNSFENFFNFYDSMTSAHLDPENGTAVLSVKAFTPQDAYKINEKLLSLSEAMVNRLNARAQSVGIAEAERQVTLATTRALRARIALAQYRNAREVIDPAKQAVGVLEIANKLVTERAALTAQLDTMQQLTPRNPSIPALRKRINAISAQITSQDRRVVGKGNGIASKISGYDGLLVEQEFATQNLNVANAALTQARNDAQRQQFYLERVVEPNLPDMPLLPSRFLNVFVVFVSSICLYFIGWMFIVGILEHAPED